MNAFRRDAAPQEPRAGAGVTHGVATVAHRNVGTVAKVAKKYLLPPPKR